MRLGMYIDMRNPARWPRPWAEHYRRWLDRIADAEGMGAEMVWLTEHHFFDDGYLPQCWTLASAVAARTTRIRIGTAVSLLPLHAAIEVAEQVALVDVISDGRVEPGFGVGYRRPEYEAFGVDFDHRYGVFAERICELRHLWGEEVGAHRPATPRPVQVPVPMWGGFRGPMGARMAGRLGLGLQWLAGSLLEPYLAGLDDGGHSRSTARMAGTMTFLLADDPERAWATARPHVEYRWDSYNRYRVEGTGEPAAPPIDGAAWIESGRFLLGTVDDVAQVIRGRCTGLPVTDIAFWGDYPGLPDDLIDRHLELAFCELRPLLEDPEPA